MPIRSAMLFLFAGVAPLFASESGLDLWRSHVFAANESIRAGRYAEAERTLWAALDEARRLEPDLVPAAVTFDALGGLYQDSGRCDAAARAYLRSIELWQKAGARGDAGLLRTANHLVGRDLECGAVADAERHYRALVAPRLAGRDRDAEVAQALTNLGSIDFKKSRYSDARKRFEDALSIRDQLAANAPGELPILLSNLALATLRTGEVDRALAYHRRAVAIAESSAERSDRLLISLLVTGADLYMMDRRWADAERLLVRALPMARTLAGEDDRLTATVLSYYAALCKASHRNKEAADMENRARQIVRNSLLSGNRQVVDIRALSELK